MTKQLCIAALVIFGMLRSNAQDSGDIELGFGAGLNVSNVTAQEGASGTPSRYSFNIGVSGEYYFSDRWGLKAELIYDNKGWADGFLEDNNGNSITTDYEVNYATLPFMANWHFGSNRNWYLNFGPYIGFLVKAEATESDLNVKDGFKSTDFGLAFGIGYKFEIDDNIKLFIEYDGQSGFTDVFENNRGSAVRNGRSSFNIGALFSL